jgi:rhomboid protease GluP
VFGALGGIVAFGLRYRALLPARYRGLMGEAAIPTVLGLFFIGLTSPGIDNWAHLGGLAAGLVAGATVRPRLLTERGGASELLLRALPSLSLVALVLLGPSAMSHALPRLNDEHDDTFGLVVPIPLGWTRGATALGASAWFNGLSGLGRASFSAEVVLMAEGADARAGLQRFLAERLSHSALGPDVYAVRADAPADVRIADRDGLKLVASIDELPQTTRLWAFFIPRGTMLYQVVFTWPAAYPRYERVMEKMLAGLRFEETTQLRRARAEAMLFPNSAAALARLGSALHETGELSAAVEALSAAVRGDPSNSRFRVALARAQLAQGDVEQACASAQEAEAFEPTDASALEAQARCEVARGNPALGLAKLEAARAAAPTDARLRDAEEKLRNSLRAMPGPVGDDAL